MKKLFLVTLEGCDDETCIATELTPTQLTLLINLANNLNREAADELCKPRMTIAPNDTPSEPLTWRPKP
jgi:hypothetical protein